MPHRYVFGLVGVACSVSKLAGAGQIVETSWQCFSLALEFSSKLTTDGLPEGDEDNLALRATVKKKLGSFSNDFGELLRKQNIAWLMLLWQIEKLAIDAGRQRDSDIVALCVKTCFDQVEESLAWRSNIAGALLYLGVIIGALDESDESMTAFKVWVYAGSWKKIRDTEPDEANSVRGALDFTDEESFLAKNKDSVTIDKRRLVDLATFDRVREFRDAAVGVLNLAD